jgi:hypothetical protein
LRKLEEEVSAGAQVEDMPSIYNTLAILGLFDSFVLSNFGDRIDTAIVWALLYLLIEVGP